MKNKTRKKIQSFSFEPSYETLNFCFITRRTLTGTHWPGMILFISLYFAIHFQSMDFMKINKPLGWITSSSVFIQVSTVHSIRIVIIRISDSLDSYSKCFWFFSLDEKKYSSMTDTRFIWARYGYNRIECQTWHCEQNSAHTKKNEKKSKTTKKNKIHGLARAHIELIQCNMYHKCLSQ